MTSVGEVMAIGRNFEEAIQKAVRMVTGGRLDGLDGHSNGIITRTAVAEGDPTGEDLDTLLRIPTDKRWEQVPATYPGALTCTIVFIFLQALCGTDSVRDGVYGGPGEGSAAGSMATL